MKEIRLRAWMEGDTGLLDYGDRDLGVCVVVAVPVSR